MTDERKKYVWKAFMDEFTARFTEQMDREGIAFTIHDRGFSKNGISLSFIDFPFEKSKKVRKLYSKLHGKIFRSYANEYKEIFQR